MDKDDEASGIAECRERYDHGDYDLYCLRPEGHAGMHCDNVTGATRFWRDDADLYDIDLYTRAELIAELDVAVRLLALDPHGPRGMPDVWLRIQEIRLTLFAEPGA